MIRVPKKPGKGKGPAAGPQGLIFPLHLGAFLSPAGAGQPGAPLGHAMSHPFSSPSEIIEGILAWVRSSLANGPWAWKWGHDKNIAAFMAVFSFIVIISNSCWASSRSLHSAEPFILHSHKDAVQCRCFFLTVLQISQFERTHWIAEEYLPTLPWSKWKSPD